MREIALGTSSLDLGRALSICLEGALNHLRGGGVAKSGVRRGLLYVSALLDVIIFGVHFPGVSASALPAPAACTTIYGTDNSETITGTDGCDIIWAYAGGDTVLARAGGDELHLGAGNDFGNGNENSDTIYGGAGRDSLLGSGGPDVTYDNEYNDVDTHCGGANDDTLNMGDGDGGDVGYGEGGTDTRGTWDVGDTFYQDGTCTA
jgi:Ca2+-binding RTX toxin-like protein